MGGLETGGQFLRSYSFLNSWMRETEVDDVAVPLWPTNLGLPLHFELMLYSQFL